MLMPSREDRAEGRGEEPSGGPGGREMTGNQRPTSDPLRIVSVLIGTKASSSRTWTFSTESSMTLRTFTSPALNRTSCLGEPGAREGVGGDRRCLRHVSLVP